MKLTIQIDGQNFTVEVGDLNSRPVRVLVDGEAFDVWPETQAENLPAPVSVPAAAVPARPAPPAARPTAAPAAGGPGNAVLAPIPGVIVSVAVKTGDTVTFGQELCLLEAMKMKNQIRANRAGTIAAVRVAPGDSVRHSQVLVEFCD